MRLMWLLAYLRMCGYSCTIVAVIAHTGEVIRVAPIRFYGILGTALFVQSFDYDGEFLVVYLEQTTNFLTNSARGELIEFIENSVRFNIMRLMISERLKQ